MNSRVVSASERHELLSIEQRRFTLYYLLLNDYTNIDTLSLQIAAWEQDEPISSVSDADQNSARTSLHHIHLPKLAENDIIEYDVRSGDIVVSEGFEEIRTFVEESKIDEEGESLREGTLDFHLRQ